MDPKKSPPQPDPQPLAGVAKKRLNILGIPVDNFSRPQILQHASVLMTSFRRHHIITANSLLILEAQKNPALRQACEEASLVIPDSTGVSWAAFQLHTSRLSRFPGIDLSLELCRLAEELGISVYLLGGEPGIAKQAARFLFRQFPRLLITGMRDGFFQERDEKSILEDIAHSQARLVLVALGMPKQEIWIHQKWSQLPPAVYIGIGGTFDVWAGKVKRAPVYLQKSGLEWLYRWGQEPTRWRRMAQLPRFALKILTQKKR